MRKNLFFMSLLASMAFAFTACSDDKDDEVSAGNENEACLEGNVCNGDLVCQNDICVKNTSIADGEKGGKCLADNKCNGTLVCESNVCKESSGIADGEKGGKCLADNKCNGTLVCEDNVCKESSGIADGEKGGKCLADNKCNGTLVCEDNVCKESSGIADGEKGGKCLADNKCNGTLVCEDNVCKESSGIADGEKGGKCLADNKCNGTLVCESDVCKEAPSIDDGDKDGKCLENGLCHGALVCVESKCVEAKGIIDELVSSDKLVAFVEACVFEEDDDVVVVDVDVPVPTAPEEDPDSDREARIKGFTDGLANMIVDDDAVCASSFNTGIMDALKLFTEYTAEQQCDPFYPDSSVIGMDARYIDCLKTADVDGKNALESMISAVCSQEVAFCYTDSESDISKCSEEKAKCVDESQLNSIVTGNYKCLDVYHDASFDANVKMIETQLAVSTCCDQCPEQCENSQDIEKCLATCQEACYDESQMFAFPFLDENYLKCIDDETKKSAIDAARSYYAALCTWDASSAFQINYPFEYFRPGTDQSDVDFCKVTYDAQFGLSGKACMNEMAAYLNVKARCFAQQYYVELDEDSDSLVAAQEICQNTMLSDEYNAYSQCQMELGKAAMGEDKIEAFKEYLRIYFTKLYVGDDALSPAGLANQVEQQQIIYYATLGAISVVSETCATAEAACIFDWFKTLADDNTDVHDESIYNAFLACQDKARSDYSCEGIF